MVKCSCVLPPKRKEIPHLPTAFLMESSMVKCSVRGTREVEGEAVNCVDAGWFGSCQWLGWKLGLGEGFVRPFCRWLYHNCK